MKSPTIRRAVNADIPALLDLLIQVNMVHHNGRPDLFNGPATKYGAEELRAILADDSRPVFVWVDTEDRVCGYVFCVFMRHPNDNILTDIRTLYIDDLCVDENARGEHIGHALFDRAVAHAREMGCYNVTLNVWTCNPQALGFYEHLGMTPQKICMEKIL